MPVVRKDLVWTITARGTQRRVTEREGKLNPLKRASVGLLAALIAVGPSGAVEATKVNDDASLLRNESNPDLVGGSFTQPLELQDLDVIFAPTDVDPDTIRRLGPGPWLRSPVVAARPVDIARAAITSTERISPGASPGTPAHAAGSAPDGRRARP